MHSANSPNISLMTVTPIHRPEPDAPGVVTPALLDSWAISLRADRKSPRTIKVYRVQADAFLRWAAARRVPAALDRNNVRAFLADENARGLEGNTLVTRFKGLQRLAAWLTEEGEVEVNPMAGMKPPQTGEKPVPVLTDDEVRALVRSCQGRTFNDRRDAAALWLLIDTGARASEAVGVQLTDLNLTHGLVTVRGKGDRTRVLPVGPQATQALDRYVRARRTHRHASLTALWLTQRGAWSYDGMAEALKTRAASVGVVDFHVHRLRHTLAHQWMLAGGSEVGLMSVAGWRSREMLARYGASAKAERAQQEHRRLNLGDRL